MVEKRALSEHPFKAVVAIKSHLLPVVIDVCAKRCGYAPKGLHTTQKVGLPWRVLLRGPSLLVDQTEPAFVQAE